MFALDKRLQQDTVEITRLDLCQVLLMRDQTYPWIILVPQRLNLRDIIDLNAADQGVLMTEIDKVSKTIKARFHPYKINVAALGNVVEQLHIHVVARFQDDPAWPAPIWGVVPPNDYSQTSREDLVKDLRQKLFETP